MEYDASCKDCERLSSFLTQVKNKNPEYFCKPVPSFGEKNPDKVFYVIRINFGGGLFAIVLYVKWFILKYLII